MNCRGYTNVEHLTDGYHVLKNGSMRFGAICDGLLLYAVLAVIEAPEPRVFSA